MSQKKLIVFDLDGTIIKLAVDWEALKKLLSERYSKRYNNACQFKSISTCLSYIVSEDDEEELLRFFDIIREHELQNIDNSEIIDETVYFVKHKEEFGVQEDAALAVLSLNTRVTIKKSLQLAGISEYFDYIVGREDVRRWKPEPDGLLKIINHYEVEKDETLYIGDMKKDLITGKNAGVDAVLIGDLIALIKKNKNK
ncbi:MAG: HAD family hydrolase [Promethearchaeia archaeon]